VRLHGRAADGSRRRERENGGVEETPNRKENRVCGGKGTKERVGMNRGENDLINAICGQERGIEKGKGLRREVQSVFPKEGGKKEPHTP